MSKEMVDHPSHYSKDGHEECIIEMENEFGVQNVAIFCYLNAFKYFYRMGSKGDAEEDFDKACWYIEYVDLLKAKWHTDSFDARMEQQLKQAIKAAKKKLKKMQKAEEDK